MEVPITANELDRVSEEQLPVPRHKLRGWTQFLGLYAGEHVAATEFVIGATFVALGAQTRDILLGLLIGNVLAILSWTLITAPISTQTRLSLYTYLDKIAGGTMTKLYNWANVVIFTVISAAMITVSSTAVRFRVQHPRAARLVPEQPVVRARRARCRSGGRLRRDVRVQRGVGVSRASAGRGCS